MSSRRARRKSTVANPAISATNGMIHATRPKPVVLGAATTVVPYFCMNDCRARSSLSPRSSAAIEFAAHAVGVLAAYVIALQQNLAAAADAHQVMAQIFEAGVFVADTHEGEERDQDEQQAARLACGHNRVELQASVSGSHRRRGLHAHRRTDADGQRHSE